MYSTSTGASRASLAHTPSSLLFQRTVLAAEQPPSTALDRAEITNLVAPFGTYSDRWPD